MSLDTLLDKAKKPRAGEELDVPRMQQFLLDNIPGSRAPLIVEQFPSGHSNLTYLLRMGDVEWVLRRPPFGSRVKSAHDMGREFRILSKLNPIYPQAPKPVIYVEDTGFLGAPFYVMERIRGMILRSRPPEGLTLTPRMTRDLGFSFVDHLAGLHNLDYKAAGLGDLGKPEGYIERQVTGWARRYDVSQTDDIPEVQRIARWLALKQPVESGASLIHNDYKFDNLVLDPHDPTKIIGVLDWEMATIGDPLMDLGTALGYWVQSNDPDELKRLSFGPTALPGMLTRKEIAARYAEKTGADLSKLDFYHVFALFKSIGVIQQIYYRYRQGLTRDERFANFILGVRILAQTAAKIVEQSKL